MVTAREGGEIIEMDMVQAIVRAQHALAVKGNAYAHKQALEQIERCVREEAEEIAASNQRWRDYRDAHYREMDQARKAGKPLPDPLPHPDDTLIESGKRVRINGPRNEEELKVIQENCRYRDALTLQHELDRRCWETDYEEDDQDGPGGALLFAMIIDDILPKRFRLGDIGFDRAFFRNGKLRKRELLKAVQKEWKALGLSFHRGQTFPSHGAVKDRVDIIARLVRTYQTGELDLDAVARGKITEAEIEKIIEN